MFFCQNIRKRIFFESPTQGKKKIIISFLTEEENISSLFNEKRRIFFKTNFSKVTEKKISSSPLWERRRFERSPYREEEESIFFFCENKRSLLWITEIPPNNEEKENIFLFSEKRWKIRRRYLMVILLSEYKKSNIFWTIYSEPPAQVKKKRKNSSNSFVTEEYFLLLSDQKKNLFSAFSSLEGKGQSPKFSKYLF